MSYQIGGYTLYVPRERVEIIEEMDVEELFRLCMTAGLSSKKGEEGAEADEKNKPTGGNREPADKEEWDGMSGEERGEGAGTTV